MSYSTPPPRSVPDRGIPPPSSPSGSSAARRVLGLVLAMLGMLLALLAAAFSWGQVAVLVLAVLLFLVATRLFALWLSARPLQSAPWGPPVQSVYGGDPLLASRFSGSFNAAATTALGYDEFAPVSPQVSLLNGSDPRTVDKQPTLIFAQSPIEQDKFFVLDPPLGNERCFLLPKEGEPLVECQDRYALAADHGYRRYAVSDGVAGSFVPGPWARVVAKSFVQQGTLLLEERDFHAWLLRCSREWQSWIEQRWVPTINATRLSNGDQARDWSQEIGQGAQATLLGCVIDPSWSNAVALTINIFAIGDSEFFHFAPSQRGGWVVQHAFPYMSSRDFNSYPTTLVTAERPDLVKRAWASHKATTLSAFPGDMIVLATDTLARWIWAQIELQTNRWQLLLTLQTLDEFEAYLRSEFRRDQVEDDDVTMLVIPL